MILCGHEGEEDHVLRVLRAVTEMVAVTRAPLPHGDKVQVCWVQPLVPLADGANCQAAQAHLVKYGMQLSAVRQCSCSVVAAAQECI